LDAAIAGTREVGMAVVASTLTIIAVFLPLVFVEGIAGQLFRAPAPTNAPAVGITQVVAITLILMTGALESRAPMAFPEEAPHPQWRRTSVWQKPFAFAGRMAGAAVRGIAFGMAWLAFRIGRALAFLVGRPMSAASRVAMAPYERAERG